MPDGNFASSYLPAFSRLMGEVEQPTNTQSMMNPQFGGSPEQLQGILQHPQVQALMGQLGIHFDPSQIRQSPFLPQGFMQHHPMMGGALTSAMANVAATPEAPLVSGAGSGMSRAMQGMMGGPEMLRQYQVRQMLAPMQAMGSMIPGQEFQRKQQLMELLTKMEQDRLEQAKASLAEKTQFDLAKKQQQDAHILATRPFVDAGGYTQTFQEPAGQQPPAPEPGRWGGTFGVSPLMAPGMPPQPGGFHRAQDQPTAEEQQAFIDRTHPERGAKRDQVQADIDAGLPDARADYYHGRGEQARKSAQHDPKRAAIDSKYDMESQKISHDIFLINQDPNRTPEQRRQAQADAQQRWQQLERDRQNALQKAGYGPAAGPSGPPNPGATPAPNPGGMAGSPKA